MVSVPGGACDTAKQGATECETKTEKIQCNSQVEKDSVECTSTGFKHEFKELNFVCQADGDPSSKCETENDNCVEIWTYICETRGAGECGLTTVTGRTYTNYIYNVQRLNRKD
jgi:hypothetical protein